MSKYLSFRVVASMLGSFLRKVVRYILISFPIAIYVNKTFSPGIPVYSTKSCTFFLRCHFSIPRVSQESSVDGYMFGLHASDDVMFLAVFGCQFHFEDRTVNAFTNACNVESVGIITNASLTLVIGSLFASLSSSLSQPKRGTYEDSYIGIWARGNSLLCSVSFSGVVRAACIFNGFCVAKNVTTNDASPLRIRDRFSNSLCLLQSDYVDYQ